MPAGVALQRNRQRQGTPGTTSRSTVVGDDASEPTWYGFDHLHASGRGEGSRRGGRDWDASTQTPTGRDTLNQLHTRTRTRTLTLTLTRENVAVSKSATVGAAA